METMRKSVIDMAQGAVKERLDYEMARVMDNIADINTAATKERTVTITLKLKPNADRTQVNVSAIVKSKLEPTNPVEIPMAIVEDDEGNPAAYEMLLQAPGQLAMDGAEQPGPGVLRLIRRA